MQPFFSKYSRYIGVLLSVALLWLLVHYFSDIITWLVLAWVVSLLGSPIMKLLGKVRMKQWRIPSSIRALLVLMLFYTLFGLFFWIFVPIVVQQGRNLATVDYAAIMTGLDEPISHFEEWLIERGLIEGELPKDFSRDSLETNLIQGADTLSINLNKDSLPKNLVTSTTIHIDSLIRASGDTVTHTNINLDIQFSVDDPKKAIKSIHDSTTIVYDHDPPIERMRKQLFQYISPSQLFTQAVFYAMSLFGNFVILITSVSFIAFFFLKDEELFGKGINVMIPNKHMDKTGHALQNIKQLLTRYFSGILLQVLSIIFVLTALLSLCGIPNSFLIAFFAAIVNLIPYLGPLIGGLFAMLVTVSSNLDVDFYTITLPLIYKVIGVFVFMQVLDGFVLQPYIFSNSVKAHPLEIFIVVIVGAKFGGILGMVVAIPAYTIIRVVAAVFLEEFEIVQKLTENLNNKEPDIPDSEQT